MTRVLDSFQLTEIKAKQLEKISIKQNSEENSLFKLSKKENTSFNWLLVSVIRFLIFKPYLDIE